MESFYMHSRGFSYTELYSYRRTTYRRNVYNTCVGTALSLRWAETRDEEFYKSKRECPNNIASLITNALERVSSFLSLFFFTPSYNYRSLNIAKIFFSAPHKFTHYIHTFICCFVCGDIFHFHRFSYLFFFFLFFFFFFFSYCFLDKALRALLI